MLKKLLVWGGTFLVACTSQPQIVTEVIRETVIAEVPVTIEVTKEREVPVTIEVTRELEVTRFVEVTREVEVASEVEVTRIVERLITATPMPTATATPRVVTLPGGGQELALVYVPAGSFLMGSEAEDADEDEAPEHELYLDAFWIGLTEVTNGQYAACEVAGACEVRTNAELQAFLNIEWLPDNYLSDSQYAEYPVVLVSWFDATAFCTWTGMELPTEAQWEKAARGHDGRTYPWGESSNCSRANYGTCAEKPTATGSYERGASPYGALDMSGSVWEWVADWYDRNYYEVSPERNPTGPTSARNAVRRGGSWHYSHTANTIRVANRDWFDPSSKDVFLGFRCASSS